MSFKLIFVAGVEILQKILNYKIWHHTNGILEIDTQLST